jgi:hypothetical protein
MNEFFIQIDNILKNLPMTRHNTAADKELPENLPQELWAANRVWVSQGSHTVLRNLSRTSSLSCVCSSHNVHC